MEPDSVQWVGSPCGLHGPYIFYKAFQLHLAGRARILSLGDFFFVRCRPGDPPCIAELQLLWEERSSRQLLSSSKLYFLPEDTPQGRRSDHGEDEVIAASEKVTVKLEDLARWARADTSKWKHGVQDEAFTPLELRKDGQREALSRFRQCTHNSGLNFKDILKEKADLGEEEEDVNVLILSYPQYCRYRSMRKRIQGKPSSVQADQFVLALGGVAAISQRFQILYCRDTFDHPTLVENDSVCDEFAPNLKGRPRKKKPCHPQRRDSFSGSREPQNNCDGKAVPKVKCEVRSPLSKTKNSSCKKGSSEYKSKISAGEECRAEEQAFLVALYKYMKERKTPIERIPYLGFKQINLWTMFQAAQKLGGYETITARRQWKHVYDELGGNPGSTSAATCTRRHYERLILPYERYIKGEEDKPLPQVKPRKQEAAQEMEPKIKVTSTKRVRHESAKSRKEREDAPKAQDPVEGSLAKEKSQDGSWQKSLPDLTPAEAVKLPPPALPEVAFLEKEEEPLAEASLVPPEATIRSPPLEERQEEPQRELRGLPCSADELEEEVQAAPFGSFPGLQLPLPGQNEMEEDKIPEMASYIANCTVKVDQLGSEDIHRALKQSPKVLVVQNFDMFKEKELPSPFSGDPGFAPTPLLYSKGNPGIMSPLAKKKLLSQVSGAALSCGSYPYGSPPPLVSKKKFSSKEDLLSGRPGLLSPRYVAESTAVSRPSVIQHVQSFKPKTAEERRAPHEAHRPASLLRKPDPDSCDFSKQHLSTLAESYALKSEIQDMKERMSERRALHHSHVPGLLADFYASPPLHSLYRHAEHPLGSQPCSKYLPRDVYGENAARFPPHKPQDRRLLSYHPPLHPPENRIPQEASDDQPTDLSLPKGGHRQTTKALLRGSPGGLEEGKGTTRFYSLTSQTLSMDSNPKACRVSPMTVSAPKKQGEPLLRACKLPAPRRLDGMAHPVLSHKATAPAVGATRSLKRSLEELDRGLSEKKVRAVSPLRLPKEVPSKEQDLEGSKPAHGPPPGGTLEGHKFPLPSPIFTGLYPGTLCGGLGNRMPAAGYSHPLQYLKSQAALSPLVQPFALHSFMVHRQFLTCPGGSQQLYRHLAAAASPVGSSYGDLLHNSIYPLAALNPQPAFPPSQLSSVHPSTKL